MPRSCGDADPPTGHVGSGQELAYHTDEVCSPWRSHWKECFPRKNPNISGRVGGTRLTFVSQSATPAVPAKPKRKRSAEPQPFAGLTHKPHCALCDQETGDTAPAPPRRPDPLPPTHRRPRTVDT